MNLIVSFKIQDAANHPPSTKEMIKYAIGCAEEHKYHGKAETAQRIGKAQPPHMIFPLLTISITAAMDKVTIPTAILSTKKNIIPNSQ